MKKLFYLAIGFAVSFIIGSTLSAQTSTIIGFAVDSTATVNGGGFGANPASQFLGVVTNAASPLQINGAATPISSGFTPGLDDVVGRGIVSSGANFTGDSITWTVNLPSVPSNFVPGSFNYETFFGADLEFLGNAFSATEPNLINFDLTADSVNLGSFSALSGVNSFVSLFNTVGNGPAISTFEVTATFLNGNSFNEESEEFRIFGDSLEVDFNFQTVPEPGSIVLLGLASLGMISRRRR